MKRIANWKRPVDKPKRPPTAYTVFFQLERERILRDEGKRPYTIEEVAETARLQQVDKPKRSHTKSHGCIGFRELSRSVGQNWREFPTADKIIFHRQAEIEKKLYLSRVEEWARMKKSTTTEVKESRKEKLVKQKVTKVKVDKKLDSRDAEGIDGRSDDEESCHQDVVCSKETVIENEFTSTRVENSTRRKQGTTTEVKEPLVETLEEGIDGATSDEESFDGDVSVGNERFKKLNDKSQFTTSKYARKMRSDERAVATDYYDHVLYPHPQYVIPVYAVNRFTFPRSLERDGDPMPRIYLTKAPQIRNFSGRGQSKAGDWFLPHNQVHVAGREWVCRGNDGENYPYQHEEVFVEDFSSSPVLNIIEARKRALEDHSENTPEAFPIHGKKFCPSLRRMGAKERYHFDEAGKPEKTFVKNGSVTYEAKEASNRKKRSNYIGNNWGTARRKFESNVIRTNDTRINMKETSNELLDEYDIDNDDNAMEQHVKAAPCTVGSSYTILPRVPPTALRPELAPRAFNLICQMERERIIADAGVRDATTSNIDRLTKNQSTTARMLHHKRSHGKNSGIDPWHSVDQRWTELPPQQRFSYHVRDESEENYMQRLEQWKKAVQRNERVNSLQESGPVRQIPKGICQRKMENLKRMQQADLGSPNDKALQPPDSLVKSGDLQCKLDYMRSKDTYDDYTVESPMPDHQSSYVKDFTEEKSHCTVEAYKKHDTLDNGSIAKTITEAEAVPLNANDSMHTQALSKVRGTKKNPRGLVRSPEKEAAFNEHTAKISKKISRKKQRVAETNESLSHKEESAPISFSSSTDLQKLLFSHTLPNSGGCPGGNENKSTNYNPHSGGIKVASAYMLYESNY